jgi:peptidyl-prolyl cis-trans isomerase SurA
MPFKTKFGYHIIRINDVRDARGEVKVAHIMLKGDTPETRDKITNIKNQLDAGGDFAALAKSYSTDLATSMKGGVLPKFTSNKMVKEFSKASFALNDIGDLSEPFKTRYGWHIVKLIKKIPIGSFDEMSSEIEKKVKRGQRARLIGRSVIDRLLKEYDINVDDNTLSLFKNKEWRDSQKAKEFSKTILTINNHEIPAKSFSKYLINRYNNKRKIKDIFQEFKEKEVMDYFKNDLPNNYPDLKQTLREYREGLLLFDLMQVKIWDKADKDSIGFVKFFENNRDRYQWKERVQATIITCDKEINAKKAKKLLKKDRSIAEIKEAITSDGIIDIKDKAFEKNNKAFPKSFTFKKGVSDIMHVDNQFVVIKVKESLPAGPKELKDTRGRAISDFQDYIEKEWIKTLKNKYPIKINKKALKKIRKKYK